MSRLKCFIMHQSFEPHHTHPRHGGGKLAGIYNHLIFTTGNPLSVLKFELFYCISVHFRDNLKFPIHSFIMMFPIAWARGRKNLERLQNHPETDTEQLKYDLTVLASSKFIFNLWACRLPVIFTSLCFPGGGEGGWTFAQQVGGWAGDSHLICQRSHFHTTW